MKREKKVMKTQRIEELEYRLWTQNEHSGYEKYRRGFA